RFPAGVRLAEEAALRGPPGRGVPARTRRSRSQPVGTAFLDPHERTLRQRSRAQCRGACLCQRFQPARTGAAPPEADLAHPGAAGGQSRPRHVVASAGQGRRADALRSGVAGGPGRARTRLWTQLRRWRHASGHWRAGGQGPSQGDPVKDDSTMMDVIATILGRLVNVALFIVFSILALLFLRANTDLHMGLVAVLSIVIGVAATVLVRLLLNALRSLGERLRS